LKGSKGLPEETLTYQELAHKFATDNWAPHALEWDANSHFPRQELKAAAELGFGALYATSEYGGTELSRLDASVIFEALSTADVSTAALLSIHNMATWMIDAFGSADIRQKYIPGLANFDLMASYCLTEPNSGSDAAALQTTAKRDGDFYIVNGSKAFISGGGESEVYVTMVRTGGEGAKGISCLLIDKDLPGVSFGAKEKKMGWNTQPTRAVFFDNVRVPVENLLGGEGDGFKIAMKGINGGRTNIASCSLGGAQACLQAVIEHVKTRKQFGKSLSNFQAIQFKLAEMATDLTASRLIVREAAKALDEGSPNSASICAMAKLFATEKSHAICEDALQLFGGYGYLKDYPIEKHVRDLRVHRILEGTNEVMRMVVGRELIKE
jgi:isobutyryl-CoA dehydrogenase